MNSIFNSTNILLHIHSVLMFYVGLHLPTYRNFSIFQVGAKRGHDPDEKECLLPLLGSGPSANGLGCGFYSVEDYREILRFAKARHIEVIPEIDMPGHSHAAVRAMKVRYERLMTKVIYTLEDDVIYVVMCTNNGENKLITHTVSAFFFAWSLFSRFSQ